MTRLLYIGDTWEGSSARSLRESLSAIENVVVSEVGRDHYLPNYRSIPLRIANRILRGLQTRELKETVRRAVHHFKPDAILVFKGLGIDAAFVREIRDGRRPVVNIFPDLSPHAHGRALKESIGEYDLVISTKPFHPALWQTVYGYTNKCVCVPHGYNPSVHLWDHPELAPIYDVGLCATWRREYYDLMKDVAVELKGYNISVSIAGHGWAAHRASFPSSWDINSGPVSGRAFGEFLRLARIQIAPVNRQMVVRGVKQPGDEETTRTYQLAAAFCFFVHQRTSFVATVYDEHTEVPLWNDAKELASLIRTWLPDADARLRAATRAHARAVPEYSIPQRAKKALEHVMELIDARSA